MTIPNNGLTMLYSSDQLQSSPIDL